MLGYFCLLLAVLFTFTANAQSAPAWQPEPGHETIVLWPNGAPGNPPTPGPEQQVASPPVGGDSVLRITNVSVPTLTVYAPPQGEETGAAVVVFPGGGYAHLAIDKEGTEICAWLNSIGITAILVKYRVPDSGPYPKSSLAFEDGQRAVGLVRSRAGEWHIDPHRIGVLGFSAGAHLAAALSNQYNKRIYPVIDTADQVSCRPDFAVIIYPGYLEKSAGDMVLNPAITIDPNGPPALLVQAEDDPVHVENSLTYFLALKRAKIPAEMHIYAEGGHGYGMRATGKPVTMWPKTAAIWFHTIGVLK